MTEFCAVYANQVARPSPNEDGVPACVLRPRSYIATIPAPLLELLGRASSISVQAWNRQMGLLEAQLQRGGGHVLPQGFTLADVVPGCATHRWFMTQMERPVLPAVAAYYEGLKGRTGFQLHGASCGP